MTELGSCNPIYPFILLSEYRVLVCQKYQYACLTGKVATYLATKYAGIDPGTWRRLVEDT
jgi:hypothetical protein